MLLNPSENIGAIRLLRAREVILWCMDKRDLELTREKVKQAFDCSMEDASGVII